jgi:hypothetical protein
VIYRIVGEYNWDPAWVEQWAARIKAWGDVHERRLIVQADGSQQQMRALGPNIHSIDGTYFFRNTAGETCDPPSMVEVRLPGHCRDRGFRNDLSTVHATVLWMWEALPRKALIREGEDSPGRSAWWSALTAGAAGYFHHEAFGDKYTNEAALGVTTFMKRLTSFEIAEPHDEVISKGPAYCLAALGREYVIHLPKNGTATIDLETAGTNTRYVWFDPRTRTWSNDGIVGDGRFHTFSTPDAQDWILLIHSAGGRP